MITHTWFGSGWRQGSLRCTLSVYICAYSISEDEKYFDMWHFYVSNLGKVNHILSFQLNLLFNMAGHSLESRLRNNLSLKSCKRQSACVNMCTCLRLCLSVCLRSQVLCVCLFGPGPGLLFSRDWALVCLCLCVFLCTMLCCSIKISEYTF